jgi:hypothetical protein
MAKISGISGFIRRIGFVAGGIFACQIVVSAPAFSAPSIISGTYQEVVNIACDNKETCTVSFTAVPAGKTLTVSQVSCSVFLEPSSLQIESLSFGTGGAFRTLTPTQMPATTVKRFQSNDQMLAAFKAGTIPHAFVVIDVPSPSFVAFGCAIAGHLAQP